MQEFSEFPADVPKIQKQFSIVQSEPETPELRNRFAQVGYAERQVGKPLRSRTRPEHARAKPVEIRRGDRIYTNFEVIER